MPARAMAIFSCSLIASPRRSDASKMVCWAESDTPPRGRWSPRIKGQFVRRWGDHFRSAHLATHRLYCSVGAVGGRRVPQHAASRPMVEAGGRLHLHRAVARLCRTDRLRGRAVDQRGHDLSRTGFNRKIFDAVARQGLKKDLTGRCDRRAWGHKGARRGAQKMGGACGCLCLARASTGLRQDRCLTMPSRRTAAGDRFPILLGCAPLEMAR
jgi:hypothetical protein